MQHERGRKVRLLVAPDAVAGAEQLGVVFPKGSAPQSAGAAMMSSAGFQRSLIASGAPNRNLRTTPDRIRRHPAGHRQTLPV